MRKGQSALFAWIPVGLAFVFTVTIAFLVGFYASTDQLGPAVGAATTLAACFFGPVSCGAKIALTSGAMGAFGGAALIGGGDTVELQLSDASDARATGILPHLVMELTSSNGEPVGERVKECVYRSYTPGGSCSYAEFQSDVESLIQERAFRARILFEGGEVLSASNGDVSENRQAAYSMFIPVKGGERARLVLYVEGAPGGVWWRE